MSSDLIGKKFHKLTVIGVKENKKLVCQCDCGKITTRTKKTLLDKRHKSCCTSCHPGANTALENNKANKNDLYRDYKRRAKKNNREFDLSIGQFLKLIESECEYCTQKCSNTKKNSKTGEEYQYNGIDRVDNNEGYTVENSVSCCTMCNKAKHIYTKEEFLAWIEDVYNKCIANKETVEDEWSSEIWVTMR